MIGWAIFVIAIAAALGLGVERLMARLGVRRADPGSAPRGIREVLDRLRASRQ
ncbi:hypothetical protein [Sphaerobacter sp.]|uniref:hypothetical protein n=1 Tax=Sphaerobacter sp. TaxID=2099654 RepID=UPI001E108542|nr:hypothetical protein [Sphaerobacter sp.]MBX5444903.1 hypothetical protein [Sphaerobacter sp.]